MVALTGKRNPLKPFSANMFGNFWTVLYLFVITTLVYVPQVVGHGRLMDPPSRSSMWRSGFPTPKNYDDNQLFCGGQTNQWEKNGGKCGVCGDPWQGPRPNEPPGIYATGIISQKYRVGQVIEVWVQLTANHKGYFEFRLCENNIPLKNITQACLDKNVLTIEETGEKRFMVKSNSEGISYATQDLKILVRLPPNIACASCLFQWKYNAGNSWGLDFNTGAGCIGCGPQEQFYGCADIAIGDDDIKVGEIPNKFPWFYQGPDDEWHFGIAYVFSDQGFISAATGVVSNSLMTLLCIMAAWLGLLFIPL